MLGHALKILLALFGCALAGTGLWLFLDESYALPIDFDRQYVCIALLAVGAVLIVAAIWARLRSLVGLTLVTAGSAAAILAVRSGEFNVWQLIPIWIAAFVGVFATLIYLIAFVRGKDPI